MIVKVIKNTYTAEPLYQWDINQVLRVYGLSLARVPEVHFINQAMSKAIVRQARMDDKGVVTVDVPNSLLQKPYTITAYICGYNGTTFETHHKLDIPVNKRPKPADYTLTNDPEVYSFKALENAVQNALHDLSNAEVKLDAATGDLKDAEAVLQKAAKDIENTVNENVQAALPGFLDDTLTDPAKAAQAAAVGEMGTVLRGLIGGKAYIVSGTVTGSTTATEANPNKITFPFVPKMVIVSKAERNAIFSTSKNTESMTYDWFCWVPGVTKDYLATGSLGSYYSRCYSLDGNTLSWWVQHPSGDTLLGAVVGNYIAFG